MSFGALRRIILDGDLHARTSCEATRDSIRRDRVTTSSDGREGTRDNVARNWSQAGERSSCGRR